MRQGSGHSYHGWTLRVLPVAPQLVHRTGRGVDTAAKPNSGCGEHTGQETGVTWELLGHLSRPGGWLGRGASLFFLFCSRHLFGRNLGNRGKRDFGLVTFERVIEGVGVGE